MFYSNNYLVPEY